MTDRAINYINLLMTVGGYTEHQAANIYLKELKHLKNNKERDKKCYDILREELELNQI